VGSHVRLWKKQAGEYLESQVPPEQEIARLRMELKDLEKDDDRHYHQVATQIVEVNSLEKQLATSKKELEDREARIFAMKAVMKGEDKFVTYKGEKFERSRFQDELRMAALRFQVDEETLKTKEEQLQMRKQTLEQNRKELAQLRLKRQKAELRLDRLLSALEQERQVQATQSGTINDAKYQKLDGQINQAENRVEVIKQKRILKGDVEGPVKAAERKDDEKAAADRILETRFGDNKP